MWLESHFVNVLYLIWNQYPYIYCETPRSIISDHWFEYRSLCSYSCDRYARKQWRNQFCQNIFSAIYSFDLACQYLKRLLHSSSWNMYFAISVEKKKLSIFVRDRDRLWSWVNWIKSFGEGIYCWSLEN